VVVRFYNLKTAWRAVTCMAVSTCNCSVAIEF
jgi:hypothetical protein